MANEAAVGCGDAGALLPTMLQRIEAEIGQIRGLFVAEDPEHAAFFLEFVEHCLGQFDSRTPNPESLVYGFTQ